MVLPLRHLEILQPSLLTLWEGHGAFPAPCLCRPHHPWLLQVPHRSGRRGRSRKRAPPSQPSPRSSWQTDPHLTPLALCRGTVTGPLPRPRVSLGRMGTPRWHRLGWRCAQSTNAGFAGELISVDRRLSRMDVGFLTWVLVSSILFLPFLLDVYCLKCTLTFLSKQQHD